MEQVIGLLIVNMIILVIGIIIIASLTKIRRGKWVEAMIGRISLENINLTDCFSKEVISLYLDVLKDTNRFSLGNCTLDRSDSKISIWTANEVDSRRFYTHEKDLQDEVTELNKKLTHYDLVLLDKIVKSFEKRQDKLVTKFFL